MFPGSADVSASTSAFMHHYRDSGISAGIKTAILAFIVGSFMKAYSASNPGSPLLPVMIAFPVGMLAVFYSNKRSLFFGGYFISVIIQFSAVVCTLGPLMYLYPCDWDRQRYAIPMSIVFCILATYAVYSSSMSRELRYKISGC